MAFLAIPIEIAVEAGIEAGAEAGIMTGAELTSTLGLYGVDAGATFGAEGGMEAAFLDASALYMVVPEDSIAMAPTVDMVTETAATDLTTSEIANAGEVTESAEGLSSATENLDSTLTQDLYNSRSISDVAGDTSEIPENSINPSNSLRGKYDNLSKMSFKDFTDGESSSLAESEGIPSEVSSIAGDNEPLLLDNTSEVSSIAEDAEDYEPLLNEDAESVISEDAESVISEDAESVISEDAEDYEPLLDEYEGYEPLLDEEDLESVEPLLSRSEQQASQETDTAQEEARDTADEAEKKTMSLKDKWKVYAKKGASFTAIQVVTMGPLTALQEVQMKQQEDLNLKLARDQRIAAVEQQDDQEVLEGIQILTRSSSNQ
jgi:hypothetical protein